MRPIKIKIVGVCLFAITLCVNLQVPLYATYARAAGFGTGLTALAFAAYIGGLLPVLILLGGISDRLGRKKVLIAGIGCTLLATGLMILFPTIYTLFLTRLLQGVGVGLGVGTGTAYLAELVGLPTGPTLAAHYAALATSLGFGSGALLTTLILLSSSSRSGAGDFVPISYPIVSLFCLGCLLALLSVPDYVLNKRADPLRLPFFPNGSLLIGTTIGLAWAVVGLVISILPSELAKKDLSSWSGLVLFLVNGTGALCQPLARKLNAYSSLRLGFGLLPVGYVLLVIGAWSGGLPLVFLGASLVGAACYGFTYLGGLAQITRLAFEQRARAVSGYFLFAYLGFGLPSIPFGFLADSIGSAVTLLLFGVIIMVGSGWLFFILRYNRSSLL